MIDWTKPVVTRDGRKVRVLCTDGPAGHPIVGIIEGNGYPTSWDVNGFFCFDDPEHSFTVVQAPEPEREIEAWARTHPDYPAGFSLHYSRPEDKDGLVIVRLTGTYKP